MRSNFWGYICDFHPVQLVVVPKGKQMLLSPVASCREQGAAMGVFGSKVRALIKGYAVPCQKLKWVMIGFNIF